jgi:adenylate cyclase
MRTPAWLTGMGADPRDDEDLRQKKSLLVLLAILVLPVSIVWGTCYLAFGSPVGIIPFVYFGVSIGSLLIFANKKHFGPFLTTQLLDILLTTTIGQMFAGGFLPAGGVGLWGILAPLGALVFLEVRQAIRWFVGFLCAFVLLGIAGEAFFPPAPVPHWFTTAMLALNIVGTGTIAFTVLASFANQRNAALTALRAEQTRSEALIQNVLPETIAERLKDAHGSIADHVDSASVLFADIVDFTPLAQRLSPTEVVDTLDRLFSLFDSLVERHGLEKIKTIGDCYMAAAGVPDPCADHADRASATNGHGPLELRIGINSGPVTAGVIGRKRFLYDLWGDAVNTASRMESNGTPGRIQITRATYDLVKDAFVCEERGTISVKGKGEMETWYLVASR